MGHIKIINRFGIVKRNGHFKQPIVNTHSHAKTNNPENGFVAD